MDAGMKWVMRLKWAVYVLAFVLTAVLQFTPNMLPPIHAMAPLLLIPAVVAVAMLEGEMAGAVFGIFAGILWDVQGVKVFGFDALMLLACGMFVGLLVRVVFRNSIVSALLFTCAVTFSLEFISCCFFRFLFGDFDFLSLLGRVILPAVLYTLPFAAPYFYGARALHNWAAEKAESL